MQPSPFTDLSPFAPFEWIAENSLEAALMASVVLPVCWYSRSRPALCHLLWLLVLVKLVAPPLSEAGWQPLPVASWMEQAADGLAGWVGADGEAAPAGWQPTVDEPGPAKPAGAGGLLGAADPALAAPPPHEADAGSGAPRSRGFGPGLGPALLGAWLVGSLVVLAVQGRRALAFGHRVREARPARSGLLRAVRRTATRMGVSAPAVRELDHLGSPVIWSLGRPVFLWPADAPLGPATDSIVAHELAHLRRRDHWVAWFELAALVVCWWNPIFWFARRRVRRYAEQASDAWAVWTLPELRRGFAEALIDVAARRSGPSVSVAVPAVSESEPRDFQRRLTMIMQSSTSPRVSPAVAGLAIAATALLMPSLSGAEVGEVERAWPDASLQPAIVEATYQHDSRQAHESGDWRHLVRQAQRRTREAPQSAKAWYDQGYAQLQLGEPEQALDAFRRLADLADNPAWAESSMAAALARMNRPDEAFAHLSRAVEGGLADTEWLTEDESFTTLHADERWEVLLERAAKSKAWMEQAENALKTQDWLTAVEALGARVELAPSDGRAIHLLAYASFGTKDYDTAVAMCERHIAMGYRPETGWYNIACARSLTGDIEGGITAIQTAFEDGFYDGKLFLGDGDLDNLRADSRVVALTESVEQEVALWKAAEQAAKAGNWSAAADAFGQIVERRPDNAEALNELAWVAAQAGDDTAAIEAYSATIRHGHKVLKNLYQLARCHARLGQPDTALAYLELALATGFDQGDALAADEAFAALTDDARFGALVEAARVAERDRADDDAEGYDKEAPARLSHGGADTETI